MHYNGATMATREELEAFGILIVGGAALAFIVSVIGKRSQVEGAKFTLDGLICDPQQVLAWLDRKIEEGKITPEDVQQLLLTNVAFMGWIQQNFGPGRLNLTDVLELRAQGVCTPPPQ